MKNNYIPQLAAIALALVALAWGTSYAIIKESLNLVEPLTLMAVRFSGSAILLSLIYYNRLHKIKLSEIKQGVIIGFFMFCAFATLSIGIQYTTASKQSFLVGAYVIIVPFLAWLINKRKPDKYSIIGASCAIIGLAMLTIGGIEGLAVGDIISIFCSISFALHMIAIEKYCHDTDPITLTIIQFWTAAVIFVILSAIFENHDLSILSTSLGSIAYLIVVTTVIAFLVQNIAQKYISSTSTALILTLESVFGSIFAVFYLNESMSLEMILGCAIVFVGIITQETKWNFLKRTNKSL